MPFNSKLTLKRDQLDPKGRVFAKTILIIAEDRESGQPLTLKKLSMEEKEVSRKPNLIGKTKNLRKVQKSLGNKCA